MENMPRFKNNNVSEDNGGLFPTLERYREERTEVCMMKRVLQGCNLACHRYFSDKINHFFLEEKTCIKKNLFSQLT